jgi:hypothetical protein
MSASEKYVAAAYLVVFVVVVGWLAIMAAKLTRLQNEVAEPAERIRERHTRG